MYCILTVTHDHLGKTVEISAFLLARTGPVTFDHSVVWLYPFQFGFFAVSQDCSIDSILPRNNVASAERGTFMSLLRLKSVRDVIFCQSLVSRQ